jgi:hypothetical protein
MVRQPKVGDTVCYVLEAGPNQGACRPAIVTMVEDEWTIEVEVSIDEQADQYSAYRLPGMTGISRLAHYDDSDRDWGTWHWPSIRTA